MFMACMTVSLNTRISPILYMLGAICGSAISMDLLAQSMDPYSAQKSMDCADICGSSYAVHEFCV